MALQCFIAVLVVALVRPPAASAAPPELLARLILAATGPRIAVVVVSLDAKAAAQQGALEGAADEALERASRFTLVPAHDAFSPGAAKKRDARIDEAREKMKSGKQALDDLDNVKATESFTQALETLKDADLSRDFPALLDAWTMKAAGHATGGENGPAKKDMEAVISLAARAEFSPSFFPPELLKFAETQRKLAATARGELLVRTEPPGARVWVDGAFRGVSPVTIAGVSSTKHFVTASLGGYALGQSLASPGEEVISLASAELGPGWKKAVTDIKKDPEGATRDTAAQALGKAAQLDQVLLVVARKSLAGEKLELTGLRLEVRDGHNAAFRTGTLSSGDPEALTAFFDGLTGKDAKRDGKDPVHHFKGGGGSPVKTTAGIALLGVGVAGLAAGVTMGVLANLEADRFRQTPQTRGPESASLVANGRTYALVADISYLVGIASAVTGGVLLLTNTGGGAEDAPAAPAPGQQGVKASDDSKRRETDRRAADERRASEERRKDDERRREDEKKREDDRRKETEATRAADDKRRAEAEEAARQKPAEDPGKKASKKERDALEKKQREDEAREKKEEEKRVAEEQKRQDDEARAKKKADEDAKNSSKLSKKQRDDEAAKKKEEDEAAKKKADEEKARADAEKKKRDDDERKKREEAEKKKKKDEDHDDLRNY